MTGRTNSCIKGGNVIPAPDYITNGLVALYDGIENTRSGHNDSATSWEDLSGNDYDITLSADYCYFEKNKIVNLAPSADGMGYNNSIPFTDVVCIEMIFAVVKNRASYNNSMLVSFGGNSKMIGLMASGSGKATERGVMLQHQGSGYALTGYGYKPVKLTVDYSNSKVYVNDVEAASTSLALATMGGPKTNNLCLAGYSSSDYAALGEVYALRIYNRVLTAEEMVTNDALDRQRFGLSL